MQTITRNSEEERERFRHAARANTLRRALNPTDTDDVAYTEEDRAAWLASVAGKDPA